MNLLSGTVFVHIIFLNILSFSCETRRFIFEAEKGRIHSKKAQVRRFNICLEKASMTRLKSRIEWNSATLAKARALPICLTKLTSSKTY